MGFGEDDDSVKVLPCPFENLLDPGRVAAARAQCRIGDEEDALAHSARDTALPFAKGLNVDRQSPERDTIGARIFEQNLVLGNPDVAPFTPPPPVEADRFHLPAIHCTSSVNQTATK